MLDRLPSQHDSSYEHFLNLLSLGGEPGAWDAELPPDALGPDELMKPDPIFQSHHGPGLAAFRTIKKYPSSKVITEVGKTMLISCRDKEHVSRSKCGLVCTM